MTKIIEPRKEIIVTVNHESEKEIKGFHWFWSWHVTGFDASTHCQECLKGYSEWRSKRLANGNKIPVGVPLVIPMRGDYFYICGVRSKSDDHYKDNFHLAVRWKDGEETKPDPTYNGYEFTIKNAEEVKFMDMKDYIKKHYEHEGKKYYACRIVWFGHKVYGKGSAKK